MPDSALVYDLDGTFVWKVDGESRAQRAPVQVGLRQRGPGRDREAASRPGDIVVAAGIHKVKAGQRVRDAGTREAQPRWPADRDESAPRGPS